MICKWTIKKKQRMGYNYGNQRSFRMRISPNQSYCNLWKECANLGSGSGVESYPQCHFLIIWWKKTLGHFLPFHCLSHWWCSFRFSISWRYYSRQIQTPSEWTLDNILHTWFLDLYSGDFSPRSSSGLPLPNNGFHSLSSVNAILHIFHHRLRTPKLISPLHISLLS